MGEVVRDVVGVLLAGGRSSRMGRDKSQLPHSFETANEKMVDYGSRILKEALSISSGLDGSNHSPRVLLSGGNYQDSIPDKVAMRGPLGGIFSVLFYLREEGQENGEILVIPVDQPTLTARVLFRLIVESRNELKSSIDYQVTRFSESELPFLLKWDELLLKKVERLVLGREKECSVRNLFSGLSIKQILYDGELINLNTPEDLVRYEKMLSNSLSSIQEEAGKNYEY